jgi:hypothetical protein
MIAVTHVNARVITGKTTLPARALTLTATTSRRWIL